MSEFKKCRVIMFPTSDITGIVLHPTGLDKIIHTEESALKAVWDDGGVSQHLYITSDENIEVGDYVLSKLYGIGKVMSDKSANYKGKTPMSVQFKNKFIMYGKDGSYNGDGNKIYFNDCYKIVATTDTSLREHDDTVPYPKTRPALSQIPQSFIKQYVESGGKIEEVEIEIKLSIERNGVQRLSDEGVQSEDLPNCVFENKIKIDSNNCIVIKPIKESWSREEVEALLYKHTEDMFSQRISLEDWIDQNL